MSATSATQPLQVPPGARRSPCAAGDSRYRLGPIIPFIEGDGTGPDIWRASQHVFDAAVEQGLRRQAPDRLARGAGRRKGARTGSNSWLPDETLAAIRRLPRRHQGAAHHAGRRRHSGPSTSRCARSSTCTPASGRCVTSRACPRPVKRPQDVDMVIFRENTEDIYAGIEYEAGTDEARAGDRVPAGTDGRQEDPVSRRPAPSASSRSRERAPSG